MSRYLTKLTAKLVYATTLLDRAYHDFDKLRSLLVLAFGSESFFESYGSLAYSASTKYHAGKPQFRQGLFPWEERTLEAFFPPPPARILIGGAGGGREAFGLADRAYALVAFEPALVPAQSMREVATAKYPGVLQAYRGSYADLPVLPAWPGSLPLDLRATGPFDGAILGWCSFSHITDDEGRVEALRRCSELTDGPILVSYFPANTRGGAGSPRAGVLGALHRRANRRGASIFAPGIGYARLLDEDDIRTLAARAGLQVVHIDHETDWAHAVLRSGQPDSRPVSNGEAEAG
jgi:hypothetical protein